MSHRGLCLFPLLLLCCAFYVAAISLGPAGLPGSPGAPKVLQVSENIRKSLTDKRSYRYVQLQNGLRALLIHEPECDEAAASLRVGVGSASDPKELQGLAHFLEHMLFQGSRRFPGGHSFFDFVHGKGGSANAYTSKFGTVLSFSLSPVFLKEALFRMADIFTEPQLKKEAALKEIHAVNSEYTLRYTDDATRFAHFVRQSKLQTAFSNFSVGSLDSLLHKPAARGLDVVEEMQKFHSKWYSSNLMTLAVVGGESLDSLQSLVTSFMGGIQNKRVEKPHFKECSLNYQPFAPDEIKTLTVLSPHADIRQLRFVFTLPPQEYVWDLKPLDFVSHFFRWHGKGSLGSRLKKLGLITAVSTSESGPEYCSLFEVRFMLTEEGLKPKSLSTIGELFFLYLRAIRLMGVEEWRYKEQAHVQKQKFDYADMPSAYDLSQAAAEGLRYFSVREVLAGEFLFYGFDRKIILSLIDNYLNPQNMRVFILNKKLAETDTATEPRYNIVHRTEPIHDLLLQKWGNRFKETKDSLLKQLQQHDLSLPGPNPFISRSLQLEKRGLVQLPQYPTHLVYGQGHLCHVEGETGDKFALSSPAVTCNVFHLQDAKFNTPKAAVTLHFYFKPQEEDIKAYIMTALYVRLAGFSITEAFSSASLAGVHAFLVHGVKAASAFRPHALVLEGLGFSHRLPSLLTAVASCLGRPTASSEEDSGSPKNERSTVSHSSAASCPTRPFLLREFTKGTWEWMEVSARVEAANRTPGQQAHDTLETLLTSPSIEPQKLLEGVEALKTFYAEQAEATGEANWLDKLYEDILKWSKKIWAEVHVEGLIQGNITSSAASDLVSSVLAVLPIARVVGVEEAGAQLQVSPLEAISSITPNELPVRLAVQTRSAPLRRLQPAFLEETNSTEGETGEDEGDKETDKGQQETDEGDKLTDEEDKETDEVYKAIDEGDKETNEEDTLTDEGDKETDEGGKLTDEEDKLTDEVNKATDEGDKETNEGVKETDEGVKETDEGVKLTDEGNKETDKVYKATDEGVKKTDKRQKETEEGVKQTNEGVKETDEGDKETNEVNKATDEGVKETDEGVKETDGGVKETVEGVKKTNEGVKETNEGVKLTDEGDKETDDGFKETDERNKETDEGDKLTDELYKETDEGDKETDEGDKETDAGHRETNKAVKGTRLSVTKRNRNPFDTKNHALLVVQAGHLAEVHAKALAFLVDRQLSQRFFNVLRTDEQLGYLTRMSTFRFEKYLYFSFNTTTSYDPAYVIKRMDHFLQSHRGQILDSKELQELKDGAIAIWKRKPKSLLEEFHKYLVQIKKREYLFDLNEQMVRHIGMVKEGELEKFREERLFSTPSVAVQVYSQREVPKEGPLKG